MIKIFIVLLITITTFFSCEKKLQNSVVDINVAEKVSKVTEIPEQTFESISSEVFYTKTNLNLRENSNLYSKIISILPQSTRVKILEVGNSEDIDGIKSFWKKVCTENNEIGWCFAGYLESKNDKITYKISNKNNEKETELFYYTLKDISVYKDNSLNSKKVSRLEKEKPVKILEFGDTEKNNKRWVKIKSIMDSNIGWIFYEDLKELKSKSFSISDSNIPTHIDYLLNGFNYKSLVSFLRWEQEGIDIISVDYLKGGEDGGHSYSPNDVGRLELQIAILVDKDKNVLMYAEKNRRDDEVYRFRVTEYNNGKVGVSRLFFPSKQFKIFSKEFFDDFNKVKITKEFKTAIDDIFENNYFKLITEHNSIQNEFAGKTIIVNKNDTTYYFVYDNVGRLIKAEPQSKHDHYKFYDTVYDDKKLLSAKYQKSINDKEYFRYIFTKHDNNNNWLEAKIFRNESLNPYCTLLREITYYE